MAETTTPTDIRSRRAYATTPPLANRSCLFIGGVTIRVIASSSSIAPYPDPPPSVRIAGRGEGGGELTANSHITNPPSSLGFPSIFDKLAVYPGESAVESITSSKARVDVDRRWRRAKSNVRSGQVGNSNGWLDEAEAEQTPSPNVNAENDIVAAFISSASTID